MIVYRQPDEITTWFVAFYERATTPWINWLVPGRFKHVAVFGYSVRARTWVFIDPNMLCMRVVLLPDGAASETMLGQFTEGAAVLKVEAVRDGRDRLRPAFCCAAVVAHMLGMSRGALLPVSLWRDCLRNGAQIVHEPRPAAPNRCSGG